MKAHDLQTSRIKVSASAKNFFQEIKQDFAWIVETRVNDFEAFTLWFQSTTGDDNTPIVWNEKILFFENSSDLTHFVMSENSSNIRFSRFRSKIATIKPYREDAREVEKKLPLEILNFDLDATRKLLKIKDWESWTLEQIGFILDNLNMLTDFVSETEININVLESFLNYITFIVNSEKKKLNKFDKKLIRKTVKLLIGALIRDSLVVSRTSRFTAPT